MTFYTAQRVLSSSGLLGVNAFRRRATVPPAEEARVEARHIEVPMGGNEVLSYLDIAAPDGFSPGDIALALNDLISTTTPKGFPLELEHKGLRIAFGLNLGIEPQWREELRDLARYLSYPRAE